MPSIFTRIINGEIPFHRIAENEQFIAFLDVNPMVKGHTLVVPKQEIDYIFDNDTATLAALLPFAKRVAAAIEAVVPCKRCFVSAIGLEVPHTHLHLIPANKMGDYSFKNKVDMSAAELAELAQMIADKFV